MANNIITAFRNVDVDELNGQARKRLIAKGIVDSASRTIITETSKIELSAGDYILFLRNNKQLDINNRQFATVFKIKGNRRRELKHYLSNLLELGILDRTGRLEAAKWYLRKRYNFCCYCLEYRKLQDCLIGMSIVYVCKSYLK